MTLVGTYCHPLHVQSYPCSSRLLTALTTQEGGAPRTASEPKPRTTTRPQMERTGAVEDAPVQSQAEGRMRVDWFGCGCVLWLTSLENNRTCGGIEGGTGQHWRVRTVAASHGRQEQAEPTGWFGLGGGRKKTIDRRYTTDVGCQSNGW